MSKLIDFTITSTHKIYVYLPCDESELYSYDEVKISIVFRDKEYILYNNDFIIEAITVFRNLLKEVVNGNLVLCNSIFQKGIGRLLNDYYQDRLDTSMIISNSNDWIGSEFSLWESKEYNTWLYTKDNAIFIEVTPLYKWHYAHLRKNPSVSYGKFLKKYKTCFVMPVEKGLAISCLEECERILNLIYKNDKKLIQGERGMKKIEHDVFGQIKFNYLWEGEKKVEFFGKLKNINVSIKGEEDAEFEKSQIDSYTEFFKNEKFYLKEAEQKIFEYYQEICLEYREMFEESANEYAPIISKKDDVGNLVELTQIILPYSFGKDKRIIGLLLNCTWEEEHGLGVKFVNEKIVEVCFQDIVL